MEKTQIPLSAALEGYFLAAHARRLSIHTLRDYDTTYRKFQTFLGRDPPLSDIEPETIRAFLNSFQGLSDKTLLNYHTGLAALWTWALREGLVDHNVVRQVEPPSPKPREIVPYTEQDVKAMLQACDRSRPYIRPGQRKCDHGRSTALRDRALVLLLVDTGIRASELCNLRRGQLDLQNHRLVVLGKGRKERILPISARTAQAQWRHLATRDDSRPEAAPLFTTREGLPISRHTLRRLIVRLGKRAGVPGANVHRFRHTFAINFLRNGGSIFALQRILGHASLQMVQRYLAIAQADIETAHREASPVSNWML